MMSLNVDVRDVDFVEYIEKYNQDKSQPRNNHQKGYLEQFENNQEMIKELSTQFQKDMMVRSKQDIYDIYFWKNRENYKPNKKHFDKNSLSDIRTVTQRAFQEDDSKKSAKILSELNGVKIPVASTILFFYKPSKYPIIDKNSSPSLAKINSSYKHYSEKTELKASKYADYTEKFKETLHEINMEKRSLNEARISVRDLDKFLQEY